MERLTIRYKENLNVDQISIDAESFIWSIDDDQNAEVKAFQGKEVVIKAWFKEPIHIVQRAVTLDA